MAQRVQSYVGAHRRGAAAMVVALVVGSAMLIVSVGAAFLGLGALDLGDAVPRSGAAFAVGDACIEETLERVRRSTAYGVGAGTIPLAIGPGTCAVTVDDLGGNRRRITAVGTAGAYRTRILVTATIAADGALTVNSWSESAT